MIKIYVQKNMETWSVFLLKLSFISDECTHYVMKHTVLNFMRQNKLDITTE